MRMLSFTIKNTKELLRDPINIAFTLGFPLVLLFMLSAMQANIPVEMFEIHHLAPGIAVFGLSFLSLFSATLISKDRNSSLLQRLYTTPLTASDFILGYTLPLIPMAVVQCAICYIVSIPLGLEISVDIVYATISIIPVTILFIAIGLLCGSVLNDKQVGGVCGALLTNLSAWLSGIWFDVSLLGNWFETFCNMLPFIHAVEMERAILSGCFEGMFPHIWWVLGYAIVTLLIAIHLFMRQMKRQ